jgi:tol-pal system protein YbgF
MKLSHLLLLATCAGANSAYAEPLPPILNNNSIVYPTAMSQPATLTNQLIMRQNQLQATVATLQAKVNQQANAINTLQCAQNGVKTRPVAYNHVAAPAAVIPASIAPIMVSTLPTPAVITKAPAVLGSEQQRYESAYMTLKSGNVNLAIIEFQKIIRDYPTGSFADNSQYWLGESYLLQGKKSEAMQAFDRVVLAYPKSNKVPDALLKIGLIQLGLNNRAKAKEYLDYVVLYYSRSNAAYLASKKSAQVSL